MVKGLLQYTEYNLVDMNRKVTNSKHGMSFYSSYFIHITISYAVMGTHMLITSDGQHWQLKQQYGVLFQN